ncbi:MAG TPA: trypsin-like peptidase domain-containing protein [Chloroflexota bacterium]|jgi:S1-C subfamily serine protease|nr:trypsin-like peptidase domain-containing protein [Chloroflexota bacterium]
MPLERPRSSPPPTPGAPTRRRRPVSPPALVCLLVLLLAQLLLGAGAAAAQTPPRGTMRDYAVANGHFYTQTGGEEEAGFAIVDEGGVPLWSEFQRLGGVGALGYPVSRRFTWDGFVVQATQKAVLQWRPDLGRAVFVNLLDEMTRAGRDDWLLRERLIPGPTPFAEESGLPFERVVQQRLALLDPYPALRAAYFAVPDPLETNGLPVAPVADFGPVFVLRAQRRAFQLWKVATPFARPGDVTVVNGGDLGKEASLYPGDVVQPEPAWRQLATPPGTTTRVPEPEVAAMRRVVEQARPAVVRLTDDSSGWGSGVIVDPGGVILTNSHVVSALARERLRAVLPDGRSFPARAVGADDWTDVAVVKVEAADLPTIPVGSAGSLRAGERVVGIGYAPIFPGAPSAKAGVVRSLSGQIQVQDSYPLFDLITSDTYLGSGDSGGPLLDLSGRLIGINSAIAIARRGQSLTGFSIPIEGAQQIAQQLLATGTLPRPQLGVSVQEVTPELAAQLGLPVRRGVLLTQVHPGTPAAAAGLVAGDIIVGINGRAVADLGDLRRVMVNHKVGDTVTLSIASAGRAARDVAVTLGDRPPAA